MSEVANSTVKYAGFWRRLAAVILDTLLFMIIIMPALLAYYGMDYLHWLQQNGGLGVYGGFDLFMQYILPTVLIVVFLFKLGATPGKMLLDCVVVDAKTFQPITIKQAIIRTLGYIISILPLYLPFLWIAFDKRKQGLHDKLANTVVILKSADYSQISLESINNVK